MEEVWNKLSAETRPTSIYVWILKNEEVKDKTTENCKFALIGEERVITVKYIHLPSLHKVIC